MVRTAQLTALALVFQSLRFVLPLPPLASTLFIGVLVNTTLLVAAVSAGVWPAVTIAIIAPVVAYLQQHLLFPVFIPFIAAGNCIFVVLYTAFFRRGWPWLAGITAATGKTAFLYCSFMWLLSGRHFLSLPPAIAAPILMLMGWPQLVAALGGAFLVLIIVRRLPAGF